MRTVTAILYIPVQDATAPDASSQPIVLPMREENDAKGLRSHLNEAIMERTWPGSL